jgi:hypothetical protein
MAKRKTSVPPEMILMDQPPDVRHLAERLRNLIRETIPETIEIAYPGWHAIGYRHPQRGYFVAIFPEPPRVRLAFEWGALLPDPHQLLKTGGKQVRYLDLYGEDDLQVIHIRDLLLAAVDLPGDRAFKLELIRQSAKRDG